MQNICATNRRMLKDFCPKMIINVRKYVPLHLKSCLQKEYTHKPEGARCRTVTDFNWLMY